MARQCPAQRHGAGFRVEANEPAIDGAHGEAARPILGACTRHAGAQQGQGRSDTERRATMCGCVHGCLPAELCRVRYRAPDAGAE